jgi:prevent-host-death family protein
MKEVSIHEAESNLSHLLASVAEGEQFIISDEGKPIARLSPLNPNKGKRVLGEDKGKVWIADDFDAPLSDDLFASKP